MPLKLKYMAVRQMLMKEYLLLNQISPRAAGMILSTILSGIQMGEANL